MGFRCFCRKNREVHPSSVASTKIAKTEKASIIFAPFKIDLRPVNRMHISVCGSD